MKFNTFVKETLIHASREDVFAFHERKDAFERLMPPWQKSVVVQAPTSLEVGTRVIVKTRIGPIWQTIEAVHVALHRGHFFEDEMARGPFAYFHHRHEMVDESNDSCRLIDSIRYALPFGIVGDLAGGRFARGELGRLFAFRHELTKSFCETNSARVP